MIPVLYDESLPYATYSPVYALGKGKMTSVLRCEAHQEINGDFSLSFDYPITGPLYSELINGGAVLAVLPRTPVTGYVATRGFELFDIKKHSVPIDGVVTFEAIHVSRRLTGSVFTGTSLSEVNDAWGRDFAYPSHYDSGAMKYFYNGLEVTGSTESVSIPISAPKSSLACLVGDEESVAASGLDVYFFCTTERTYAPTLHVYAGPLGADRGASIRFGVNMLDVEHEKDLTGAYNAVVPYWDDGNGNITYADGYVVQPTTPITPVVAVPLDCSNEFETQPTSAQLVAYARDFLDTKTPWTGSETIKVDFINGAEIDPHAPDILLGDTVHVYWGDADIATDLRVVAYDYDVLAERYISLELGTPQTQYVAVTGDYAGASGGGSGGACNSDFRIYNSVTDLGLTSGSATISGAYAALPLYSVLITHSGEFASGERPSGFYGTILMVKSVNAFRGYIEAKGDTTDRGDYRMGLNTSTGVPTGTWEKVSNAICVISTEYLVSGDDLNNIRTRGIYRTGGTVPAHCPSEATWSILICYVVGTTYIQMLFNGANMWTRSGNSTTWYTWYRFRGTAT